MTFGQAIEAMRRGARCYRVGWLVKTRTVWIAYQGPPDEEAKPVVVDETQTLFVPSQSDMLARDWVERIPER